MRFRKIVLIGLVGIAVVSGLSMAINRPFRKRPNIFLITFDALRADHLGCYGYPQNTSPALDRFAAEGVVFAQAYSQTNWTGGSFATLMSSTYTDVHKVSDFGCVLDDKLETFPELLRKHGYTTVIFGKEQLENMPGIARGFKHAYNYTPDLPALAIAVKESLIRLKNKKFFLWVHLYDYPHAPYTAPSPYREMFMGKDAPLPLRPGKGNEFLNVIPAYVMQKGITDANFYKAQYDAEIAYADTFLGTIFAVVKKHRLDKKTIIVVAADHGESLGEKGLYFQHGNSLANAEIRVPLTIKVPGYPHTVVSDTVAMVDVAPTLLESAGIKPADLMEGQSLLPLVCNRPGIFHERPVFSSAGILKLMEGAGIINEQACVITGGWKCIRSVSAEKTDYELYNLRADPLEVTDLSGTYKEQLRYCSGIIEAWEKRKKPTVAMERITLSPEAQNNLKSLGYAQ